MEQMGVHIGVTDEHCAERSEVFLVGSVLWGRRRGVH